MPPLHRTLLALALAGIAASGQAATATVQFDAFIFEGVPAPHYDVVSIKYPKLDAPGAQTSKDVAAGRFQGEVLEYSGVDPGIFVDGLDDLYLYCYDVYEGVGGAWVVDYTINFDGASGRTLDFLGAVNQVLGVGLGAIDPYAWLRPSTAAAAAAIQLGIWESKYDDEKFGWDIGKGSFKADHVASETRVALASFFDAIASSAPLEGKYVMTLEAVGAQDMITGDPPSQVPEPGTLALLGAAAIGLLPTRRRAGRWSKAA